MHTQFGVKLGTLSVAITLVPCIYKRFSGSESLANGVIKVHFWEIPHSYCTPIQAVVFLEPGSASFKAPLNYSIPSLSTGTELCTEKPACCLRGNSFDHFYTNMQCPKIVMNITVIAPPHTHTHTHTRPHTHTHTHTQGVGHCSILDEVAWDLCHLSHFCKTDKNSDRDVYRNQFIPGLLASFYGTYLQENPTLLQYTTTPSDMPLVVNYLQTDLNC